MRVRVLGPTQVTDATRAVELTPRERTVLAALALRAPRSASSAVLIDVVWRDDPPGRPDKALQTLVLRLRQSLPVPAVETVPGGYALAPAIEIDADQFEHTVRSRDATVADLDVALGWWTGRAFEDLDDWEPAEAEARRLGELRCVGVERRVTLLLETDGASMELVAELEGLVAAEPLRERRWLQLATALASLGRQTEALHVVDRARGAIERELGVDIGPELAAFERSLRGDRLGDGSADPRLDADAALGRAATHQAAHRMREALEETATAARSAREAGDSGRLADAALAAASIGALASLDETAFVVALLQETLQKLPLAPSRRRALVLAALARAVSHARPAVDAHRFAREAMDIALVLADEQALVQALLATLATDDDPATIGDRRQSTMTVLELSEKAGEAEWRRRALPHLARIEAQLGDLAQAEAVLDELASASESADDLVGQHHSAAGGLLRATAYGSFTDGLHAAEAMKRAATWVLLDPAAGELAYYGQVGLLGVLFDEQVPTRVASDLWPLETMRALAIGAASSMAARHGHVGTARSALAQLTPDELARLPRDHYWWAAVWLVAEACFACGDGSRARALYTAAVPFRSLFCVDPVCMFLGSMEHHLGLLAHASGDQTRAVAHLDIARDAHRRLGCARWAELTDRARDAVARR